MTHENHEQRIQEHHHGHGHHGHHGHGPDLSVKKRKIHPAWWIILGVVLTLLAVLAWVGYPWF
jgi:hypothetical protein